jgi:hypothetical protein
MRPSRGSTSVLAAVRHQDEHRLAERRDALGQARAAPRPASTAAKLCRQLPDSAIDAVNVSRPPSAVAC